MAVKCWHAVQISMATNAAVEKLRAAGPELIPFDSTAFDTLAEAAWPGPSTGLDGASAYESVVTLGQVSFAICDPGQVSYAYDCLLVHSQE